MTTKWDYPWLYQSQIMSQAGRPSSLGSFLWFMTKWGLKLPTHGRILWYTFLLAWWFITMNRKNCCAMIPRDECFQQAIYEMWPSIDLGLWIYSWHNGCTTAACRILRFIDGERVDPPVFSHGEGIPMWVNPHWLNPQEGGAPVRCSR